MPIKTPKRRHKVTPDSCRRGTQTQSSCQAPKPASMVIGLLTLTAIPTVTGVGQAVSAQKRQNAASKEQEKFHLTAVVEHHDGTEEPAGTCILKDGKVRPRPRRAFSTESFLPCPRRLDETCL